jgi:hypothetical protein
MKEALSILKKSWIIRVGVVILALSIALIFLFSTTGKQLISEIMSSVMATKEVSVEDDKKKQRQNEDEELNFIEEKNGLKYEIKLNNTTFKENDEINVKVKVTNVSDADISFGHLGCTSKGIRLKISDKIGKLLAEKNPDTTMCTAEFKLGILKKGESQSIERIYLPTYQPTTDSEGQLIAPHTVPTGSYNVTASFYMVQDGEVQEQDTVVSIPITITTSWKEISIHEDEALKTALHLPKVKQWMSELQGNTVVVSTSSHPKFFTLKKERWSEIDSKELNKDEPIVYAAIVPFVEDSYYIVRFKSYQQPYFMEVKIDASTGKILFVGAPNGTLTSGDASGLITLDDVLQSFEKHGLIKPHLNTVNEVEENIFYKKYSNTVPLKYTSTNVADYYIYVSDTIQERENVFNEFREQYDDLPSIEKRGLFYHTVIMKNTIIFVRGYGKRGILADEITIRLSQLDEQLSNK